MIDRIHTTAGSHSRVMCIEIMGNKAGWLTLYAGIAGGADIILIPELPYDIDRVCAAVERRAKNGSNFSIIAVAEGAMNAEEARMKRKEWAAKRAEAGFGATATNRIAAAIQKKTGLETRVCIPGHMQRGGTPCAYDRVLSTQFGSHAAKLVEAERYGVTVAMVNNRVVETAWRILPARAAISPRAAICSPSPAAWASAWADMLCRVLRTKQAKHVRRSAPIFTSIILDAQEKSAKRKRAGFFAASCPLQAGRSKSGAPQPGRNIPNPTAHQPPPPCQKDGGVFVWIAS